jgi:hypothetical protein
VTFRFQPHLPTHVLSVLWDTRSMACPNTVRPAGIRGSGWPGSPGDPAERQPCARDLVVTPEWLRLIQGQHAARIHRCSGWKVRYCGWTVLTPFLHYDHGDLRVNLVGRLVGRPSGTRRPRVCRRRPRMADPFARGEPFDRTLGTLGARDASWSPIRRRLCLLFA